VESSRVRLMTFAGIGVAHLPRLATATSGDLGDSSEERLRVSA
jgi:hypothetical protein